MLQIARSQLHQDHHVQCAMHDAVIPDLHNVGVPAQFLQILSLLGELLQLLKRFCRHDFQREERSAPVHETPGLHVEAALAIERGGALMSFQGILDQRGRVKPNFRESSPST